MKTIHASTQPGRRLLRTMSTSHGIRSMTETDSCKQRTEILDGRSQSQNKTEITKLGTHSTQRDTNIMVNPRHDYFSCSK
jgi:hypothetical protein